VRIPSTYEEAGLVSTPQTMIYEVADRVARITLNRPERGNGLSVQLIAELTECVERADVDPSVHVILLSGNGSGFCGGYDLEATAEMIGDRRADAAASPLRGSPWDPAVIAANHDPSSPWDAMVDYAMMVRNVRAFMTLFSCDKPVVCKVHGFCVAGGTDLALCADLLLIAADAKIGYPPTRAWGSPTTSWWAYRLGPQRAKRLLFTGDCLFGAEALEWGLAIEAPAPEQLDERTEIPSRADRPHADQPAADDEAARQPVALQPRAALHSADRRRLRRDRAPSTEGYVF
jgi:enoyl-CoA hydratase/carnithine racemase